MCVLAWTLGFSASAQTKLDLRTQSKSVDFSTATFTKPVKTDVALPATCSVGELFFSTGTGSNLFACTDINTWKETGRRIPTTTLANLPTTCPTGDMYFITDTAVSAGGWNLYSCTSTNVWSQAGVQADGTGYLIVTCPSPSSCLVGPNLAVLPTLTGPNAFLGSSDFSAASKSAMFRLAASAPATCDATTHEAYYDTTANTLSLCTAADTWTALASLSGANTWVNAATFSNPVTFNSSANLSGATKTAMFRLAATAPSTCDAALHEAYYNTTTNSVGVCSSTNTWTPIGGTSGSFLLYYKTNVAALTATGAQQTLDSFVIPAGTLKIGDVLEIEATFARTGSADPMTFGISFGGSPMQSVATSTSTPATIYKPSLTVTGTATEVWSGVVLASGASPTVIASSADATAGISAPITVSLTQNGTGPDTGAVISWFVKVTR
jgi:hypothetical protein